MLAVSDYEANYWWSEKFIEKYQQRDIFQYPALQHVQIRFSKHEKDPAQKKMVMFSFQDSIHPTTATPLTIDDYHSMFKQNFKECFMMYYCIGKKYL